MKQQTTSVTLKNLSTGPEVNASLCLAEDPAPSPSGSVLNSKEGDTCPAEFDDNMWKSQIECLHIPSPMKVHLVTRLPEPAPLVWEPVTSEVSSVAYGGNQRVRIVILASA